MVVEIYTIRKFCKLNLVNQTCCRIVQQQFYQTLRQILQRKKIYAWTSDNECFKAKSIFEKQTDVFFAKDIKSDCWKIWWPTLKLDLINLSYHTFLMFK